MAEVSMDGPERPRRGFVAGRKRARHRFTRVLIATIERFTSLGRRPTDADDLRDTWDYDAECAYNNGVD
jgi:hypothetical protein